MGKINEAFVIFSILINTKVMAGCGYVCPQCEGRGFTENGEDCDWCADKADELTETITDTAWIKEVHEGKCCADD